MPSDGDIAARPDLPALADRPPSPGLRPELIVEHDGWNEVGDLSTTLDLVRRAGQVAGDSHGGELTILLTDDRELHELNLRFRGKDKPTNVLSFPSGEPAGFRGDIAIAYETARREAAERGIPLADHLAHLAVHGTLHLLGFDHETGLEAEAMEALETTILAEAGIADPYDADSND